MFSHILRVLYGALSDCKAMTLVVVVGALLATAASVIVTIRAVRKIAHQSKAQQNIHPTVMQESEVATKGSLDSADISELNSDAPTSGMAASRTLDLPLAEYRHIRALLEAAQREVPSGPEPDKRGSYAALLREIEAIFDRMSEVSSRRTGSDHERSTRFETSLSTRPLHYIWIVDSSGSMNGAKIAALNSAISDAIPRMRDVADGNPQASILVQAVTFSSGARWIVPQPTPISEFAWTPVQAGGLTDLGAALRLVAEQLNSIPNRALPPVLVLLTDGQPTDDYEHALQTLLSTPWGRHAVRIGVAIGQDADRQILRRFMDGTGLEPLEVHSPDQLIRSIRWASTSVVSAVSKPASGDIERSEVPPAPVVQSPGDEGIW